MNKKCFADKSEKCLALQKKKCAGCRFYKPLKRAIEELEATPGFDTSEELQALRDEMKGD